jgi:hypothetical protein
LSLVPWPLLSTPFGSYYKSAKVIPLDAHVGVEGSRGEA